MSALPCSRGSNCPLALHINHHTLSLILRLKFSPGLSSCCTKITSILRRASMAELPCPAQMAVLNS